MKCSAYTQSTQNPPNVKLHRLLPLRSHFPRLYYLETVWMKVVLNSITMALIRMQSQWHSYQSKHHVVAGSWLQSLFCHWREAGLIWFKPCSSNQEAYSQSATHLQSSAALTCMHQCNQLPHAICHLLYTLFTPALIHMSFVPTHLSSCYNLSLYVSLQFVSAQFLLPPLTSLAFHL